MARRRPILFINSKDASPVDLQSAIENFKKDRLTFKEKDLIRIYDDHQKRLPNYGVDLQSGLAESARKTDEEKIGYHLGTNAQTPIIFFGFNVLTPLEEEYLYPATLFK